QGNQNRGDQNRPGGRNRRRNRGGDQNQGVQQQVAQGQNQGGAAQVNVAQANVTQQSQAVGGGNTAVGGNVATANTAAGNAGVGGPPGQVNQQPVRTVHWADLIVRGVRDHAFVGTFRDNKVSGVHAKPRGGTFAQMGDATEPLSNGVYWSDVVHVQSGVAKEGGSTFFPDQLTGTPLGRLTLLEAVGRAAVYARGNGGIVPVPPQPGSRAASFKWFGQDLGGNFISGYLVRGLTDQITGFWPEQREPVNTGQVNKWVAAAPVVQPPPVQIDLTAPD